MEAHLRHEHETYGKRGGEEGEQGREHVHSIRLLLDHEGRWDADEGQYKDVVDTDTCDVHYRIKCTIEI